MSLTKEKIQQIEAQGEAVANDIFAKQNSTFFPPNLYLYARELGYTVVLGIFEDPTISGLLNKKEKTIYLNANESSQRRFFTLAHEIGHLLLHPKKQGDITRKKDLASFNGASRDEEQEANWFAASVLLPEFAVRNYWNNFKVRITGRRTIEDVAEYFAVSESTAKWRVRNLGLLKK